MENNILKILKEIEKNNKLEILFAVEAGSRVWEFASPDSDYDIRFVYTRPIEEYIKINKGSDQLSQVDTILDIVGWDLRKFFSLLAKGNAQCYEWLFSPIIYINKFPELFKNIVNIAQKNTRVNALYYHYLNLAKSNYIKFIDSKDYPEKVSAKIYLYCLRSIYSARFVLENSCPPPISFQELLQKLPNLMDSDEIYKLIEQKKKTSEKLFVQRNEYWDNKLLELFEIRPEIKDKTFPIDILDEIIVNLVINYT